MSTLYSELRDVIKSICPPTIKNIDDGDKPLVDFGLDSLDMSGVLLAVEEKYGITIPDEDVDTLQTLNQIAAYVSDHKA